MNKQEFYYYVKIKSLLILLQFITPLVILLFYRLTFIYDVLYYIIYFIIYNKCFDEYFI